MAALTWGSGGLAPFVPSAAHADEEDMVNPFEGDAAGIADGEARFAERCAFCHGGRGRGGKGPPLTTNKWKRGSKKNSVLYLNIAAGVPSTQMGSFGTSLSQDEILKIMAFLRNEYKARVNRGEIEPAENY
jgi:mono/diheme cytochrome c family protein